MTSLPPFQLGLIGYPLGHSLSPKIHQAALKSCGLRGSYTLFPVRPDDAQGLRHLLARLRAGELHGLNVTIPHKQTVIPLLDKLTPYARAIGAVNTIYMQNGCLCGDNTDAPGFLADLNRFVGVKQNPEASALILGAGGAARAVVYALLTQGWDVVIAARRSEQAQELAAHDALKTMPYQRLQPLTFNLLINATPLGMFPDVEASPWPANIPFPPRAAVYDLVYNPTETKFIRAARAAGLSAVGGLGMLLEQAALSFERWTGCLPPREILSTALETL